MSKSRKKETKENNSQEHENIKENSMSTHAISKEEKQTKKETSSAVGKTKVLNELAALENQEKTYKCHVNK